MLARCSGKQGMTEAELDTLLRAETLLLLLVHPLDAAAHGGLIAQACRHGRPPLVAVLTDGVGQVPDPDAEAARQAKALEAAMAALGLPAARLLLLGLHTGRAPETGRLFAGVAEGLRLLMWRADCGVICAPAPTQNLGAANLTAANLKVEAPGVGDSDRRAASALAAHMVAESGVAWLRAQTAAAEPLFSLQAHRISAALAAQGGGGSPAMRYRLA